MRTRRATSREVAIEAERMASAVLPIRLESSRASLACAPLAQVLDVTPRSWWSFPVAPNVANSCSVPRQVS